MKNIFVCIGLLFWTFGIKAQCDELELISPFGLEFCEGDEISLEALSFGGGEITWSDGENGIPFELIGFGASHTFVATSSLMSDCILEVEVTIHPKPIISFSSSILSGCTPLNCSFLCTTTPPTIINSWFFGDGYSGYGESVDHMYETAGLFDVSVMVTTSEDCSNSLTYPDYISVAESPEVTVEVDNSVIVFGDSITFSVGGALFYSWNIPDVEEGVPHTPTEIGIITYVVTGLNMDLCSDSAEIDITVLEPVSSTIENELLISKVFPNPTFGILTIQFGEVFTIHDQLIIYTITGEEIYSQTNITDDFIEIDTQLFEAGIYTLAIINPNDSRFIYTEQIIVE